MEWIDIASIVFVCVTANHLGLVKAVEDKVQQELPIINCPKCLTWWCVMFYGLWCVGFSDLPLSLAISFLASYVAIWIELFEGFIDTIYNKVYEKIYRTTNDTASSDTDVSNTNGSVSCLRKENSN